MAKRTVKSVLLGRKARAVLYFILASGAYLFLPKLPELASHFLQVIVVITVVNLLERFVLWNEFIHLHREATREVGKSLSQVVGAAVECGLTGIYFNRKKSIPDVKEAIAGARLKIWLLGVGLAAELSLHELAPILSEKINKRKDVRVLLLDPLKSPGVFRTCLESPIEEVQKIVCAERSRPGYVDPLFYQLVYTDFQKVVDELQLSSNAVLKDRVRFYGHNPNCWLVITDDTAYFEPYTFGSAPGRAPHERSLGPYMPVLRFQREPTAEAFQILENHFVKLWLSSDVTFLNFQQRWLDRDAIVKEVFSKRGKWLREVYEIFNQEQEDMSCDQDRRSSPRQPCSSAVQVKIEGDGQTWDGTILDSSSEGLCLRLSQPFPAGIRRVKLLENSLPAAPQVSPGAMLMLNWFVNQHYEVARPSEQPTTTVALRRAT